jgi:hypothetical protein
MISTLVLLACTVNVHSAVTHYPAGTMTQAMPASPVVIPTAPGLTPTITQPNLVSAQMAPALSPRTVTASAILAAAVSEQSSLAPKQESLPVAAQQSWELFLQNNRDNSNRVKDWDETSDGGVVVDMRGKNRSPNDRMYITPLKAQLNMNFPDQPQSKTTVFDVRLPSVEAFAKATRDVTGFELVFPKGPTTSSLPYKEFAAMLAKGRFPMMEMDDLYNHWPRLMELKGMAPVYADIAATALSIRAGTDKKASQSEIGWRRDFEYQTINQLHDFANTGGHVFFRDRATSDPARLFPTVLKEAHHFLDVIIERLVGVRPSLRANMIKQLSMQGSFGRALADKLKRRR